MTISRDPLITERLKAHCLQHYQHLGFYCAGQGFPVTVHSISTWLSVGAECAVTHFFILGNLGILLLFSEEVHS